MLLLQIAVCILLADFISGLVHWAEDSYGDPEWPLVGVYFIRPNIVHHYDPRHFVRSNTFFGRIRAPLLIATVIACGAFYLKLLTWQLILTLLFSVCANQVHKYAHSSAPENGPLIRALQRVGTVQSAQHHAKHHQGKKNIRYCALTDYLNPILDGIGFWRVVEWLIWKILRVQKRVDPSVR